MSSRTEKGRLSRSDSSYNNELLFAPRARTIDVFSSSSTLFLVATVAPGLFRVLFFDRREGDNLSDILYADPKLYDRIGLDRVFREPQRTISERRQRATTDAEFEDTALKSARQKPIFQFTASALLGVVRFLKGFYLLFLTDKRRIGYVNGHAIYAVEKTRLLPVAPDPLIAGVPLTGDEDATTTGRGRTWSWLGSHRDSIDELEGRYLSLFQLVDLTKGDFFFSYTLDLTNTLQSTFLRKPVDDAFAWNAYLTLELREAILLDEQRLARKRRSSTSNLPSPELAKQLLWTTDSWLVPLIHGSFQQQRCSLFGKTLTLTLLGRRSRFNAGTRYLKRGINEQGKVANHVEVEQIFEVDGVSVSSFVQVRGSIPTYWMQDTSAALPKPPIKQYRFDPTFQATRLHFSDLLTRYGAPIMVLNLVKQAESRPKESLIGKEFADAVEVLNCSLKPRERIYYDALDFKKLSKVGVVGRVLEDVGRRDVDRAGVFFTDATNWTFQNGSVRTNCIDGLDRTNVGQFSVGLSALAVQLQRSGVSLPDYANTGTVISGPFLDLFVDMFESLGDRIAQQYGGSQAHKKGGVAPTAELLTSIRRYYSNSFTDRAKQDAINLFLGWFVPRKVHLSLDQKQQQQEQQQQDGSEEAPKALWELESDYYLHNFRVTDINNEFPLTVETGMERWWRGNLGEEDLRKEMIHAFSKLPRTSVVRLPPFDEDSMDEPISFEKLAEPFFRPMAIDQVDPNSLRRNPLRRLFKDKRGLASGTASTAGSDEDEDPSTLTSTVAGGGASRLGGNTTAGAGGMGSIIGWGGPTAPSPSRPTTDTMLLDIIDSAFLANSDTLLDDTKANTLFNLESIKDSDLGVFIQAENIARDAHLAFDPRPIDPALVDHIADFIVSDNDVEGNRRIVVDTNAVSEEIKTGEMRGLRRGQTVSDLFMETISTKLAVRLPNTLEEELVEEEKRQREIFTQYLNQDLGI